MKPFTWSEEKNILLKKFRGVSFEDVEKAILNNKLFASIEHYNQQKYPGQKVFVIEISDYAYYVPYIEEEEFYFLKTIFPNRKATKKYIKKGLNLWRVKILKNIMTLITN